MNVTICTDFLTQQYELFGLGFSMALIFRPLIRCYLKIYFKTSKFNKILTLSMTFLLCHIISYLGLDIERNCFTDPVGSISLRIQIWNLITTFFENFSLILIMYLISKRSLAFEISMNKKLFIYFNNFTLIAISGVVWFRYSIFFVRYFGYLKSDNLYAVYINILPVRNGLYNVSYIIMMISIAVSDIVFTRNFIKCMKVTNRTKILKEQIYQYISYIVEASLLFSVLIVMIVNIQSLYLPIISRLHLAMAYYDLSEFDNTLERLSDTRINESSNDNKSKTVKSVS
jgi:hypothetical protein